MSSPSPSTDPAPCRDASPRPSGRPPRIPPLAIASCILLLLGIGGSPFRGSARGSGLPSYRGLPPIASQVRAPTGVAVDREGRLYVTESSPGRLLVFSPGGALLAEKSGLSRPVGVAVSPDGKILVGLAGRGRVEAFDPNLVPLFALGKGDGEFSLPMGIAVDGRGIVYVADGKADRIRVYDGVGAYLFSFGGSGDANGQLRFPAAVACGRSSEEIVVTDLPATPQGGSGARVQVFSREGVFQRAFASFGMGEGLLVKPLGAAVDGAGRIFVSDAYQNVVQVFDPGGTFLFAVHDAAHPVRTPLGIALGPAPENLYVASLNTAQVAVFGTGEGSGEDGGVPTLTFESGGGSCSVGGASSRGGASAVAAAGLLLVPLGWLGSRRRGLPILLLLLLAASSARAGLSGFSPAHPLAPNTDLIHYPHIDAHDLKTCEACHFLEEENPSLMPDWAIHAPVDNDDTMFNNLCRHCHNDLLAPFARTHSSLTTSTRYGDWNMECVTCHEPHCQLQLYVPEGNPHLLEGVVQAVTDNTLTAASGGWTDNQYRGLLLIPNLGQDLYVYRIDRNSGNTLYTTVPIDLSQVAPGDPFAVAYGKLVRESIAAPSGGSRTVRLFRPTGANSLADGDANHDGVCEVCHTATTHFRNDGGGSDPLHANLGGAAGTECTGCHSHANGFMHGGGGGAGSGCGDASGCHGLRESHPVHVGGGGRHLTLACSDCHNTSNFPQFADNQSLAGTAVCDSCHSPGGTYDGVSDPTIGSKNNWDGGVYTDNLLQAGKERWCASCHDESPSVIGGVTAPNVVGSEGGSYPYGTGWGYYKTGHGLPGGRFYPSSGGVTYGAGLGCGSCHDLSTPHVDGLARTFDDGDSSATSPALYRQGYRLKLVGGQEPMLVPWPGSASNSSDNFRLCAGCHAPAPFLDNNSLNTNLVSGGVNRHEYHLDLFNQLRYSSDWSGAANSRITCVTCHNVHGSTRLAMVRDGTLVGREPGLRIWYSNPAIVTYSSASSNPPVPESLPLSASTGIVWSGGSSSNLCTHCHGNVNLSQLDRTPFQNVSLVPTLDWTGEAGFVSDGVSPDTGPGGTNFEFRVKYTDGNNDPPLSISLRIDRNDDGDFLDAGETVPLQEADAADTNRTDGKIYRVVTLLNKAPDGSLSYRFDASDATGSAVRFDPVSPREVSFTNSVPTLAWTGQSGYLSDGVNPNGGPTGGTFEFRVLYADLDDEIPSFINLRIDRNDDGDFLDAGETVPMSAYDADPVYSDGKIYTVSVVLTLAGDGVLEYRFEASDGLDAATGTPASTSQPVTVTSGSNTPPVLSWTGAPGYAADGVDPDLGAGGRPFTFQVSYADADGDLPGTIEVWVDRNDNGDFLDPGEMISLAETDPGDTDVTDGKTYAQTVVLDHPGGANKVEPIAYLFSAQDSQGADASSGAPVSAQSVRVQDAIQVPDEVSTITAAIASAVAGDIVLVAPGSYGEYVNFNGKDNVTLLAADEPDGPNASILTNQVYAGNQNGGADNVTIYGFRVTSTVQPAFNFNQSQITVDSCRFDGNTGNSIYVNGPDKVTVRNSTFRDNLDESIYLTYVGGFVDVENCTFTGNTGNSGGAIYSTTSGTWNISDSVFLNNTSTESLTGGGAIYTIRGAVTIDNCVFRGNATASDAGGGAIYITNISSLVTIVDTVIQGNTSGTKGGGGIYIENNNRVDLTNVILSGNRTTGSGGAVYEAGYANYLFCTISGNYAGVTGGALYHLNSLTTTLRNSILYNNDAATGVYREIYTNYRWNYVDVYDTLIDQAPGSGTGDARLSYEDMGGNLTGSDPLFVGGLNPADAPATGGDYHLQSGSPCIGAANSGSPFDHDIDGDARPGSGGYDMGVDEFY